MAFSKLPISYCANVHPGHSFAEVLASLNRFTLPLRERLSEPLAVGLWLASPAMEETHRDPVLRERLAFWLADYGLSCYTLNAFPFGNFHHARVKENVYLPDWTTHDRANYTKKAADLLAFLLPSDAEGSISTAPLAFKLGEPPGRELSNYFPRLIETAVHMARLREQTGRTIRLAIEPEPCCVLETTDETIAFFNQLWKSVAGSAEEQAVREHLGICFDVCHQAVEFEDVADSIRRLNQAGVRIQKVHVTCALELRDPLSPDARQHLARFAEERYLHQTMAVRPLHGKKVELDLSEDFAAHPPEDWLDCPVWRVHFHVPVHEERLGPLYTTRPVLEQALRAIKQLDYAPHLEVETYTWNVMPEIRQSSAAFDLVSGLAAEMNIAHQLLANLSANPTPNQPDASARANNPVSSPVSSPESSPVSSPSPQDRSASEGK